MPKEKADEDLRGYTGKQSTPSCLPADIADVPNSGPYAFLPNLWAPSALMVGRKKKGKSLLENKKTVRSYRTVISELHQLAVCH